MTTLLKGRSSISGLLGLLASIALVPAGVSAQTTGSASASVSGGSDPTTPRVITVCVTRWGIVYQIKAPGLRGRCARRSHREVSWTVGLTGHDHGALNGLDDDDHPQYMSDGEAAAGDLGGNYPAPTVVGLQGNAVSATAPAAGQVLTWSDADSRWAAQTPTTGVTDHGALIGLADNDHPQYLLTDGVRNATNGFAVTGTAGSGSIPTSGAGVRLMWYAAKGAFRAGGVGGDEWDDANVGLNSVAMGTETIASGAAATALGNQTIASGDTATAMGNQTTAGGRASTAMGSGTRATGKGATAMGILTTAHGIASTAIGVGTTASGVTSLAMGGSTTASGRESTAMGAQTTASGEQSIAMGQLTTASGARSVAMGENTTASGHKSTAMGFKASTNGHAGAFVYGDASSGTTVNAPAANSFTVRAAGGTTFYSNSGLTAGASLAAGAGAWATVSDRNRKHLFLDVDGESVLNRIARMSIQSWTYKAQDPAIRHIGPTAQDFSAAFALGGSDTTITTSDISGINILAIQALEARTRELSSARAELAELRQQMGAMEAARAAESAVVRQRLARLEATLTHTAPQQRNDTERSKP